MPIMIENNWKGFVHLSLLSVSLSPSSLCHYLTVELIDQEEVGEVPRDRKREEWAEGNEWEEEEVGILLTLMHKKKQSVTRLQATPTSSVITSRRGRRR